MPAYNPPLRDMQFVLHEVLNVTEELKAMPKHADVDADTERPPAAPPAFALSRGYRRFLRTRRSSRRAHRLRSRAIR